MLLEIENSWFGYNEEEPILADFSLGVDRGEFVALLGPSGCGKSTLLNLAAGLLVPLAGEVKFEGKPLRGINRRVGYMTQGDTLLPWQTVERNVGLPLELAGMPLARRQEKIAEMLELVGLKDAGRKYPSELSGGMRRRTLLARSLIYDPPMLLMDEPFGALDAQLRELMHAELLNTVERVGSSVLFVTHDIAESVILADRIIILGNRPLVILDEVKPGFGKKKDLAKVRNSPEYAKCEQHLRRVMSTIVHR
ncbi:MAG: ABC transporter ATP-binding protein [Rhizobiaceae bacterium]|nr:ABC transporter ATP-binding protein [Rhizobiaceae bacterium]